jgi:hypothetical protein
MVATVMVFATPSMRGAVQYPFTLTVDAQVKSGVTTVTSKLTIRVDRLMAEAARTRVSDALRFGGYPNFLNALRPLPVVGTIESQSQKVEIRYAHEEPEGGIQRLVLVADRPLFFLGADPKKAKAGYELTVVELRVDAKGGVAGSMAGAARVKPSPDGSVILDSFTESLVDLKGALAVK